MPRAGQGIPEGRRNGSLGKKVVDFKNVLLLLASVVFSVVVAEGAVRYIDGHAMFAMPLIESTGTASIRPAAMNRVPRAAGVEPDWFFGDPDPLPNRRPVPDDWQRMFDIVEANASGNATFRAPDIFKAWNSVFAGPDPCKHWLLQQAPGQLFLYDPADGAATPPYRFLPNMTTPVGLTTNQIGWRGRPVESPRDSKTVRIVFVGSSTVVDFQHLPFSWPEFVGHWLNVWAKSKGLAVRFEVLNAGRESIASTDIAAIVHTEVLPLRPDLVVYHEGGNQFRPESIVEKVPEGAAVRPAGFQDNKSPHWLQVAARYSAIMVRVQSALATAGSNPDGHEWPKPDYHIVWPAGLDEFDPDLAYPKLPVNLNIIQRDLDRIRADVASVGGELAISSFYWMVKDGMVVDPVRHRYLLEQLNVGNWPFHYRELERLAAFQNRLLAKYAKVHGLTFVDIVRSMPFDPDLFVDAVHTNYAGSRIRAWAAFNQLLPTIEQHLAKGTWPKPWPAGAPTALPIFTPRQMTLACKR